MTNRTVLITGATGQQGGAVLRALAGTDLRLRAMTRKPESDAASALLATGATLVKGDLDDADSVRAALSGAWGVFAVQNTWEAGVEQEEAQGKRLATLAREAGVQHFVYTSVASAQHQTGIPHFDNKYRIERTIVDLDFPSHAIMRPVFFMENLVMPFTLQGDSLLAGTTPGTRLQMVAVKDIGTIGARLVAEPDRYNRREIDIAGDECTLPETAALLSTALGRPIRFVSVPLDVMRTNSEDLAAMFEWFNRVGYSVDIPALAREFGFRLQTLPEWAEGLKR
jgi:uncharacterized protein YbjT (DUF2867 family)